MAKPRETGSNISGAKKPKIKRSPVVAPRPEVAVRAPKVTPRRGSAPTVFTESPIRNPVERIQTQQARHTARAIQNAAHAERGSADKGATPAAPKRPLTNREAAKILASPQARTVEATVPKPKVKKGKGFKLTPAAILSDIPAELKGAGAVEGAITRIGATSAKGWAMVPGVGHELGNVVKDTSGVVAGAVPSIAIPVSQIATGHPGKAVSTLYKGVKETVKHPLEHPVSLALILRGGEGAVSRGAGEIARRSPSEAVRAYGETHNRMPISLGGTTLETRTASKGLIENRAQKALDRRQARKEGTVVVRTPLPGGTKDFRPITRTVALKPTKRQLNGPHVLGGKLDRRVDTEAGKHNVRVRDVRTLATNAMAKVKPTTHEDAVALVNEGVIKRGNQHRPLTAANVRVDLQAHLDQLTTERAQMKEPADLAQNAEQVAQVERLLHDEKFLANPKAHLKAARVYAESLRATEPARVHYGDLTDAQVARRPLLPFAAREMGLRFDEKTKRFVHELKVPPVAKEVKSAQTTVKNIRAEIAKRTAPDYPLVTSAAQIAEMNARLAKAERRLARVSKTTTTPQEVSNQTIVDAFTRKGGDPRDLAYVPALDRTGASNFYGSGIRRPGAENKSFTGRSAVAGTYPRTFDALHQHLVGSAVRVARHQSVNNLINSFGLKQASGKFFDTAGAKQEIANLKAGTGEDYVAVTAARQTAPDTLIEDLTPEQMQQTFHAAEPGDSHVVLFPKRVWDRLQEHEKGRGRNAGEREVQRVSQTFRHVVLLTSTKWLAGNTLENYLRMQINELTPVGVARTIAAGKKFEADVAKRHGDQVQGELRGAGGSGMFTSQAKIDMTHPEQTAIGRFAHAFRTASAGKGKITSQIGPNGIANLWDKYSAAVTAFNGLSENSTYFYGLGKQVREEVKAFNRATERTMRKGGAAYKAVVEGAADPNKIAEYARGVDDIRGRYTNLSPTGRYFVSTYTPFAPWYVNSLHFFAITLPAHHPVKTGVLAAASVGTADKRKELNLPPWAQGVPYGDGKVLPIQNFLPTGAFANGLEGPTSLVLPQVSSVLKNLAGLSWSNQQLPAGTSHIAVALNTAGGSFLPFYSKLQTVLERGGKSQPDSTLLHPKVKAGTKKNIVAGIKKAVLPIRPQQINPQAASGPAAGLSSGPSASDILGNAAGPSVSDILGGP